MRPCYDLKTILTVRYTIFQSINFLHSSFGISPGTELLAEQLNHITFIHFVAPSTKIFGLDALPAVLLFFPRSEVFKATALRSDSLLHLEEV